MPGSPTRPRSLLRRVLGFLLGAGLVLSAVPALILFDVQRHGFEPATYQRALANTDFYRQFPVLLAGLVQENIGPGAPHFVQRITAEQWQVVMRTLLPEPQLQATAQDTITQAFAFLNGDSQQLSISLSPLKLSLAGPAGLDAALYILRAQPDCTIEQAAAMLSSLGNEICNPPGSFVDLLRPYMQAALQNVAAGLPDRVAISGNAADPQVRAALADLQLARKFMRLSPALPLFFLLGLTLVMVRTVRDWLAWWGWPLLATGLIGLPSSLIASPILAWLFQRLVLQRMSMALPAAVMNSLRLAVGATLSEMLRPVISECAALLLIGAGMVIVSHLGQRRPTRVSADTQPSARVS
ncbi:MAG TPA: hypothetical protein VF784_14045 [Anaerolineales bacterium]